MEEQEQDESLLLEESLHELRLATIRGDLCAVQTALRKGGLSVDQPLKGGWTALMYACSLGHPQLVQYFLDNGGNPNFHKELYTALMAACASSQPEQSLARCVDLLLAHGAHVNTAERHHMMTALMFAAKEGHTSLVARLTAAEHHCNVNAQDSQGWTALFWAVNKGKPDVVEILMARCARPDIKDRSGLTAIRLAQNKQLIVISDILNRNHTRPPDGQTFLIKDHIPERESKITKKSETMLEVFLDELSNNNNDRYSNSLSKILRSMELENDLEALKIHRQVLSNIVHSVNGCLQKSIVPINRQAKSQGGKESTAMEINWRNIPYSAVEAREALSHMVRQLDAMYATMSYVRHRMQGNPPAAMVEDKHSRIAEINFLSDKALHYSRLVHDEIKFFRKYTRQLEERHPVPADFVVEQKTDDSHVKIISSCLIAAAIVVVLFNSRAFKLPIFGL